MEGREGGLPSSEEESPLEEEGDEGGGEGGGEGGIPDPPAAGFKIGSVGFTVRLVSPNCPKVDPTDGLVS